MQRDTERREQVELLGQAIAGQTPLAEALPHQDASSLLSDIFAKTRHAFPNAAKAFVIPPPRRWRFDLVGLAIALLTSALVWLGWYFSTDPTLARLDWWEVLESRLLSSSVALSLVVSVGAAILYQIGKVRLLRPMVFAGGGFVSVAFVSWVIAEVRQEQIGHDARAALSQRHWITLDPLGFDHQAGRKPTKEELARDLKQLRDEGGFDGLITFGADGPLGDIPALAKQAGFKAVIMGLYVDPQNPNAIEEQLAKAIQEKESCDAYCVGHNPSEQIPLAVLAEWMARLRQATGKPVTTTFPLVHYLGERGRPLRAIGDFYLPDARGDWRLGATHPQLLRELRDDLQQATVLPHNKPVILKMIGMPSGGGPGLTLESQRDFYRAVHRDIDPPVGVSLAFHAGYDVPWKGAEPNIWAAPEEHVGLFTADRKAKPAVAAIRAARK